MVRSLFWSLLCVILLWMVYRVRWRIVNVLFSQRWLRVMLITFALQLPYVREKFFQRSLSLPVT
ncbi:hypothetical protein [Thalassobacillus sp. C254]|uniref:hypothetical protein n=1 Tax=Thalassobacillus sp. C254 TaxID=1225341 RepID=UPI0012ECC708|nr:hypothetical protein [Thalassobacillus sp. C254]